MNTDVFDVSKITAGDLLALEVARKEGDTITLLAIMNKFCAFDVYQLSFADTMPYIQQFAETVNTAWKTLDQSPKDHS